LHVHTGLTLQFGARRFVGGKLSTGEEASWQRAAAETAVRLTGSSASLPLGLGEAGEKHAKQEENITEEAGQLIFS